MLYITRRERFNAAHKLYKEEWSEARNLEVFGKCSNPNWHGHNYELFVTVKGNPNPETGLVMDLKALSTIIKNRVTEKLDHKNMNLDVDFMKDKMPSAEVLAQSIWEELEKPVHERGGKLHAVRLQETENNFVEYYGN